MKARVGVINEVIFEVLNHKWLLEIADGMGLSIGSQVTHPSRSVSSLYEACSFFENVILSPHAETSINGARVLGPVGQLQMARGAFGFCCSLKAAGNVGCLAESVVPRIRSLELLT